MRSWAPVVLLALAVGIPFASAQAAIYKYTDRHGVTHYSDSYDSVPAAYRDQVRDVAGDVEDMTGFNVIKGLNGGSSETRNSGDSSGRFGASFGGGEMLRGLLGGLGFGIVLVLLIAIPIVLVIGGLILQLACRIGGADPPGLGRAIGILFVQGLAGGAANGLVNGIAWALKIDQTSLATAALAVGGVSLVLSFLVNAAVLMAMASIDFLRALWVCIVHLLLVLGPIVAIGALVWLMG